MSNPKSPGPLLVHTRSELKEALLPARRSGERVGLVPTMGALHAGHASLMTAARAEVADGPVVVSVFVNPLQFGHASDLSRYPRTLEADLEVCRAEGADVVFAPSVEEVYPGGHERFEQSAVTVDPGGVGSILEGASRPGHFRGVLTVVAKLFGLVQPDVAVFGQKDYQQLALIRRMVSDLNFGLEIVGAPTLREPDGLAMSSRNRFLTATERTQAPVVHQALQVAGESAAAGSSAAEVIAVARELLARVPDVGLDYLVITDPLLQPLPADPSRGSQARALIAVQLGTVRLIDNLGIEFG